MHEPLTTPAGRWGYPRLRPDRVSRILAAWEEAENTATWLRRLRDDATIDLTVAAWHPSLPRVPEDVLRRVRDAVREVCDDLGFPTRLNLRRQQLFDNRVGRRLHETMEIIPFEATERDVWSYLSLILLPEVGPWRFPERARPRLTGHRRNVFRRLWWRAHVLGADLDQAPPGCEPFTEDEYVQIMERPTVGGNPRLARAIRAAVWRRQADVPGPRTELVRDLPKRVLRLTPFRALGLMEPGELDDLLDRLIDEYIEAVRGA